MITASAPLRVTIAKAVKRVIGRPGVSQLRRLRAAANAVAFHGSRYYCPLCRSTLRTWIRYADAAMTDAECPVCGSLGRHRFLWMALERFMPRPGPDDRILHFAPEWTLERALGGLAPGGGYVTGDIVPGKASRVLDLTRLDLPGGSFDWIVCSHVLEHIPDDTLAIAEMVRVLAPNGCLLIQVPIRDGAATVNGGPGATADERTKRFGLHDHVRLYGTDLLERLATAGLTVEVFDAAAMASPEEFARCALDMDSEAGCLYSCQSRIYCCRHR